MNVGANECADSRKVEDMYTQVNGVNTKHNTMRDAIEALCNQSAPGVVFCGVGELMSFDGQRAHCDSDATFVISVASQFCEVVND